MRPVFEFLLFTGVVLVAAGCYGGNALIGAGHGFLLLAIGASFFVKRESCERSASFWLPLSAWLLVAFIVVCILSVLFNWGSYEKPFKDLKKLRHLLIPVLILALPAIRSELTTRREFYGKWAFAVLLVVAVVATIADMINLATGIHLLVPGGVPRMGRLGGIFGMVMTYAYSMQFTVFVVAGFLVLWWKKWMAVPRWIGGLAIAGLLICSVGTVLSGSRGALLGCVVGGIVLLFLLRSRWMIAPCAVLAILAVFTSLVMPYKLEVVRPNEGTRVAQWKTAMVTGLRHPLAGIGYRQFEKQSRDLKVQYGFPHDVHLEKPDGTPYSYHLKGHGHNNYLEALASTGVFGMLSLLIFFLAWLMETWKNPQSRLLFAPAIVGFMVAGFFENSFFDGEITAALMLYYVVSQLMLTDEGAPPFGSANAAN